VDNGDESIENRSYYPLSTVHAPVVTSIEPDHGPIGGGIPITITDQYFAPRGVRVSLGGEHAFDVRVVDEHTIIAVTHWHRPGPVDVVVSTPTTYPASCPTVSPTRSPSRQRMQAFVPMMGEANPAFESAIDQRGLPSK